MPNSFMKSLCFLFSPNWSVRPLIPLVFLIATTICPAQPLLNSFASPANDVLTEGCLVPGLDDHCERWVSVYDNPNGHSKRFFDPFTGLEEARAEAISPQGDVVYVTGYSWDNTTQAQQFATLALDVNTGARRWVARFGGLNITSYAYDVAVSPDGKRLFVVGQQYRFQQGQYFSEGTIIAYEASTGKELWVARTKEPFTGTALEHVAVSPDGTRVYASGLDEAGGDFGRDEGRYGLHAYSASNGKEEWVAFHDNPQVHDSLFAMALDPKGERIFLTGYGGVVAYEAATGAELWANADYTRFSTVAADGSRFFATSQNADFTSNLVAYGAATGKVFWSMPLPQDFSGFTPVVADPRGERVYVAITPDVTGPNDLFQNIDAVTMAFDASSGRLAWTTNYDDPRFIPSEQDAFGLAISPDGRRLYLAAQAIRKGANERGVSDISTIAYDAANGSQKWVGRYSASPGDFDVPFGDIEVTPDGSKVIVAGILNHHPFGAPNDLYPRNAEDYVVLAYDTAIDPGVHALRAVSRKVHGAAGTFDLAGIECRRGGPNNRYQMVVTFPRAVTFRRAALSSGTGNVTSARTSGREVTVNLTGVANAQTITLTLFGVSDGVHTNDVSVALSVLVGDVSASGSVTDTGDLPQVQGQSGQAVTKANFREDVTANGFIGTADISLVESKLGTVLP